MTQTTSSEPNSGGRAPGAWRIMLALVALAAFLRFYRIEAQSLWVDEILTVGAAEIGGRLGPREFFTNVQGPLHALIVHLVAGVSDSTSALRSVSALFGTALVPLSYLLGKAVVDRATGLLAALFVALSPFSIWYSQELRNYSLLMFLSATATLVLWRAVAESRASWSSYVVATVLSVYTNLSAAFLVFAHALFAAPRAIRDGVFMRRAVPAFVAVVALASPLAWGLSMWTEYARVGERATYAPKAEASQLQRGGTTFSPMAAPYAAFSMAYGYSLGPGLRQLHSESAGEAVLEHAGVVAPAAAVLALIVLLGLVRLARRRGGLPLALAVLLIPLAATSLLAVFNIKPFNPRYVAVSFPMFIVVASAGITFVKKPVAALISGGFIVFCLISLRGYYFDPQYWKEDVREAARYVELHDERGDMVLVPVVRDVFNFYYDGPAERFVFYRGQAEDADAVESRIRKHAAGARRLWYVAARTWDVDPAGRIPAYLTENHRLVSRTELTGVSVYLYELVPRDEEALESRQSA